MDILEALTEIETTELQKIYRLISSGLPDYEVGRMAEWTSTRILDELSRRSGRERETPTDGPDTWKTETLVREAISGWGCVRSLIEQAGDLSAETLPDAYLLVKMLDAVMEVLADRNALLDLERAKSALG